MLGSIADSTQKNVAGEKNVARGLALAVAILSATPAQASDHRLSAGDVINGKKLYAKACAACHGEDGRGGKTSVNLTDSGRMNLIPDEAMFALIRDGKGAKTPAEHRLADTLAFLDVWDVVAHVRTLHLSLDAFFPDGARYVSKAYTIDTFGLERIEKASGKKLEDPTAPVFTFFKFPGEEGRLTYVPQDPIKIDQLKKDKKLGYLVFLPLKTEGFDGELGLAMDKDGVITRLRVQTGAKGAENLEKSLSKFVGMGKKGLKDPFKVGGGKPMEKLAADLFPVYLRAMETVTMYDREENERTWADE